MSSAVLDRVLAIPDHDDVPQMGLSRSGLAALVERGGVTLDGTKAKSSVLKRADVKGDRTLSMDELKQKATSGDAIKLGNKAKLVSHAVNGGTVSAPNRKGENMEITYNKKGDFKKAHVSIKNTKTGESTKMAMTRDQLDTYLSNLDGAKPIDKPSSRKLTPEIAAKAKKAIANLKPKDAKAKVETDKALKMLDSSKGYLERANAKALPKKPSADASYSEKFDREQEKKQIMKERQGAKAIVGMTKDDVAKAMRKAPKYGEFIDKKYGGFENIPRDSKGKVDQEAIAKDFVNSPYANVKVRKATRKSSKVAGDVVKGDRAVPSKPATKFEKGLRAKVKAATNDNPFMNQRAVDQVKDRTVRDATTKVKFGTKLIQRKAGQKISSDKRKKRAMTDRDIARNAGIKSAKLESQGQLNIFNQPKPSTKSAKIAPETAKKVKTKEYVRGQLKVGSQRANRAVNKVYDAIPSAKFAVKTSPKESDKNARFTFEKTPENVAKFRAMGGTLTKDQKEAKKRVKEDAVNIAKNVKRAIANTKNKKVVKQKR
jgi:hypothetical protein